MFLSTLSCPSELVSDIGAGETWRFCRFSSAVAFGGWFCPFLVSPGCIGCECRSSGWGLSPGNYWPTKKVQILEEFHIAGRELLEFSTGTNNKPQLFVSTKDISHVSFYLQHEQSYHIASKGNFHLSHNKRKLHVCMFGSREHKHKVQNLSKIPN